MSLVGLSAYSGDSLCTNVCSGLGVIWLMSPLGTPATSWSASASAPSFVMARLMLGGHGVVHGQLCFLAFSCLTRALGVCSKGGAVQSLLAYILLQTESSHFLSVTFKLCQIIRGRANIQHCLLNVSV